MKKLLHLKNKKAPNGGNRKALYDSYSDNQQAVNNNHFTTIIIT